MDTSFMNGFFESGEDEIDFSYVDNDITQEEEYENVDISSSVEITEDKGDEIIKDILIDVEITTNTTTQEESTTHKVPVWYFYDLDNSTSIAPEPTRMQVKSLFELEFADESFVELDNAITDETDVTQATFRNNTSSEIEDIKQGNNI